MGEDTSDSFELHREFLSEYLANHPYLSWLGVTLDAIGRGRVAVRIPFDKRLVNNENVGGNGVIHGGIIATLVDHASGMAVRSLSNTPCDVRQATVNLDISYIRPATDDLFATGEVVRTGGGLAFTQVTVESIAPDGQRKAVATGSGIFRRFSET